MSLANRPIRVFRCALSLSSAAWDQSLSLDRWQAYQVPISAGQARPHLKLLPSVLQETWFHRLEVSYTCVWVFWCASKAQSCFVLGYSACPWCPCSLRSLHQVGLWPPMHLCTKTTAFQPCLVSRLPLSCCTRWVRHYRQGALWFEFLVVGVARWSKSWAEYWRLLNRIRTSVWAFRLRSAAGWDLTVICPALCEAA